MSEVLNNREYRQKAIKEIIMELHQGKAVQQVKARFDDEGMFAGVLEVTQDIKPIQEITGEKRILDE